MQVILSRLAAGLNQRFLRRNILIILIYLLAFYVKKVEKVNFRSAFSIEKNVRKNYVIG